MLILLPRPTAFQPVVVTGKMAALLFSLHTVTDGDSLAVRHRAKIGLFRRGHPTRPYFVFFAWIRSKVQLDKLAPTAVAFNGNQKIAIRRLRE